MVIEHTFVTTLGPAEAGAMASELLKEAGFADSETTAPQGPEERDEFEMKRDTAGQFGVYGPTPCPQSVRLEYDRGRIVLAASIAPQVRGPFWWSPSVEPAPNTDAAQPYVNLMIVLAEALEETLVRKIPGKVALDRFRTLDGVIPQGGSFRGNRCKIAIYSVVGVFLLGVIGGVLKHGHSHPAIFNSNPTLAFPANEDARDAAPSETESYADMRPEQLRIEADTVLRSKNLTGQRDVGVRFAMGDHLAKLGRWAKAFDYYEAGLARAPADFPHRVSYAQLLLRHNNRPQAEAQMRIVRNECEDITIIAGAQKMLGETPEELTPLAGARAALVLVPMGDVDVQLLQDERAKLSDEMGIDVQVHSVQMSFMAGTINPLHRLAELVRVELDKARRRKPKEFAALLRYMNMSESDLADDTKIVNLGADCLRRVKQIDSAMNFDVVSSHADIQWAADGMTDGLATAIRPLAKKNGRFLGITRSELYGADMLPTHSYCEGNFGVVSYRQFMSAYTKETPSRSRLLRRLHTQLLIGAGQVFGIPDCDHPGCARAHTTTLPATDAKREKMCDVCRKAFADAVARAAKE